MILNRSNRQGFHITLSGEEAVGSIIKDLNILQQYLKDKSRCFSTNSYKMSALHLIQFLYWYKAANYYDPVVYMWMKEETICDICGVLRKVVCPLKINRVSMFIKGEKVVVSGEEIISFCEECLHTIKENTSITKLLIEVSNALAKALHSKGFKVYASKSNSSKSVYFAVDGYYHIRVSDHENTKYNGGNSIICCKNPPRNYTTGEHLYVSVGKSYADTVQAVVNGACKKRDAIICSSSKKGYKKYINNAIKTLSGYSKKIFL